MSRYGRCAFAGAVMLAATAWMTVPALAQTLKDLKCTGSSNKADQPELLSLTKPSAPK